jgi:predicted acyl esterase
VEGLHVRRLGLLFLVLLLPSLLVGPTAAGAVATNEWKWSETFFASGDGTSLHADIFLPKAAAASDKFPVILSIGPYFGSASGQPTLRFQDMMDGGRIFERGYAYVQVDSRGYGGSGGCYNMGGSGEQLDAKSAVEWAAQQPWSTGKVGMWGKSYDAWTQVMALANDPKGLEAVVIQSPLIGIYQGVYENGVQFDGWNTVGVSYLTYDVQPNGASNNQQEIINHVTGTATGGTCYADHNGQIQVPYSSTPYYRERDLAVAASNTDVPVLWSHGFNDVNTKPNNFLPVWENLDSPHRAWFGQWDHVRGNEVDKVGRAGFIDEAMAFFGENLKGEAPTALPAVEVQDGEGQWRTEAAWPPADATPHRFPILPGSYDDVAGNSARTPSTGIWTFTQPAPYDLRFAGPYEVAVQTKTTAPNANLISLLYDVGPDGKSRLIQRGAKLIEGSGPVRFESMPQDWILREGHRLGLLLTPDDSTLFGPTNTRQTVQITSGTFAVPFLEHARTVNLEGTDAAAMSSVPAPTISAATISARTVSTAFPAAPK